MCNMGNKYFNYFYEAPRKLHVSYVYIHKIILTKQNCLLTDLYFLKQIVLNDNMWLILIDGTEIAQLSFTQKCFC